MIFALLREKKPQKMSTEIIQSLHKIGYRFNLNERVFKTESE